MFIKGGSEESTGAVGEGGIEEGSVEGGGGGGGNGEVTDGQGNGGGESDIEDVASEASHDGSGIVNEGFNVVRVIDLRSEGGRYAIPETFCYSF